jgi:hypothetical protein
MDLNSPLVWFLVLPLAGLIALVAGAFVLQAACALCNIEDLGFFKALVLVLVLTLANAPVVLGIFLISQFLSSGGDWNKNAVLGTVLGLGYPLHWLISGLILFWPLHVTYTKGVLVAILHNVISLVVAGVLGGLVLVALALVQLSVGSP